VKSKLQNLAIQIPPINQLETFWHIYLILKRRTQHRFHHYLIPTHELTRLNRETANDTQPLYSSGFFFTKASIKLAAAVTTP
jgi:hypothetical protein